MSLPYTFANVTELDTPNLDSNFNALGALVTVQCTATGTNTVTLTAAANAPVVTAYGLPYPVRFGFTAGGTSTGPVTMIVGTLAALNVYLPSGSQAGANGIVTGNYYEVVYLAALNSGAGGFLIVSSQASAATGVAGGSVSGLKIVNDSVTPNTKIDVTATNAVMITTAGAPFFASGVSVVINCGTTGPNGLDTGSLANATWYNIFLISNGSTVSGLASLSATAPTMPSGYTYKYRVGAMITDSSAHFLRTLQQGRRAQYTLIATTNTTVYPPLPNVGIQGTFTSSTFTGVSNSLAGLVPPTACRVALQAQSGGSAQSAALSPNANFSGYLTTTPPPITVVSSSQGQESGEFEIENPTNVSLPGVIYYSGSGSASSGNVMGWEDNI